MSKKLSVVPSMAFNPIETSSIMPLEYNTSSEIYFIYDRILVPLEVFTLPLTNS
jgi:hypothetical protein